MTIASAPPFIDDDTTVVATVAEESGSLVRSYHHGGRVFRSSVDSSGPDPLMSWWNAYWDGTQPKATQTSGTLRMAEIFAGSGGLGLGFRQAASELGFETTSVVAIDHDTEAVQVYARNHDTLAPLRGSVSEHVDYQVRGSGDRARFRYRPQTVGNHWAQIAPPIDVLLAGPPCQGHSHLNNHTRGDDPRNELYLTVPALAIALDVPIVIIENVPAVVNDRRGVVATTITLLQNAGYRVEGRTLKADELGWPQRRRRYFLIATRDHAPIALSLIAHALRDNPRPATAAFETLRIDPTSHMARTPVMSPENLQRIEWLFANDAYDLELSERPDCHRDGTTYLSVYGRMRPDQPAPTITTGFMTIGRGRYVHPLEPRVIYPVEAARLQGFPDGYDFLLEGGEWPSTFKLTKWIGDAVPMPLGHAAALSALLPLAADTD